MSGTAVMDIVRYVLVVAMALLLSHYTPVDAAEFIAAAALWYGIRAWSRAGEVNTAHKNSEG